MSPANGCGQTDPTAIKWLELKRLRPGVGVKRIPDFCMGKKVGGVAAEGATKGPDWRWGAWVDSLQFWA